MNQNTFFKWAILGAAIILPVGLWFITPGGIKEISKAIRFEGATIANKFDAQREVIEKAAYSLISVQEKDKYLRALDGSRSVTTWQAAITDDIAKAEFHNFIAPSGEEYVITRGGLNNLGQEISDRIQKAKPLLLERDYYEAVAIGVFAAHLSDLSERAEYTGYPVSLPVLIGCVAGYVGTIRAEAKKEG